VDRIVAGYSTVVDLMRELKAIGAHNVTQGRARGLTGRRRLEAMTQAYEQLRRDGKLPATWEVIHASAWGGERRDAANTGISRESFISPSAIRRRGQP
jgi:malonyl-CoA O-methyltransferase